MTAVFTSIIAYAGTNIDDIFVLMILLTQAAKGTKGRLVAGHFLGVSILTLVSMLGALGLQNLPLRYVGILGLVPIGLGIKAWFGRNDEAAQARAVGLLSMAMITLGNGADNIGVYIPLFTGFSYAERLGAVIVFICLTALWVFLANTLAELPKVKSVLETYKSIAVPVVFIALGVFIILDSGLIG